MVGPVIVALLCVAPQDTRGELQVAGARGLAVTSAGDLWLVSRDGQAYVSRDWNQTWTEVDVGARKPDELDLGGDVLEEVRFFDAERGFIAGYVGEDTHSEILRTTDGGRTWSAVWMGIRERKAWVYDAQVSVDGHAWLVGSMGLMVSDDFGATWHSTPAEPFEGAARCATVCFRSAEIGVVGALGNVLNTTTDGGRTWKWVNAPIASKPREEREGVLREGPDELRVEGVWLFGERLVVLQRRQLFHTSFEDAGTWTALDLGGRDVLAAALASEQMVVVTDDLRVHWLEKDLVLSSASEGALDGNPFAIAAGARGVAFLTDVRGRVCTLESGALACASLRTSADAPSWPITSFDRCADGTLLGISTHTLYRSQDSGQSWERLGESPWLNEVRAAADGSHALLVGYKGIVTWRAEGGALIPLQLSEGRLSQFTVQARVDHLWLATAFEADEDERTQFLLHSSDTVEVGPGFRALVFASPDEGLTWTKIYDYRGAIVHAAWLGGGVLSLCMSDGTIHRGALDPASGAPIDGAFKAAAHVPGIGGHWATWLAFPDATTGWAGGNLYFEGTALHRSLDGGKTWTTEEPGLGDWVQAFRLGGGACVRIRGVWHAGSTVECWQETDFRETHRFDGAVHDAHVDAGGCLLVRMKAGDVWSLAADGQSWSRIGTIPVPRD